MSEPTLKSNPFFSTAFLCLLEEIGGFASNRYAWRQLIMYGLNAGRHVQLLEATKKVPTSVAADSEMRGWIWNLDANTKLPAQILPPPGDDDSAFWLLMRLLRGETENALAQLKKLSKNRYESNQIIQATHALALARSGSRDEARAISKKLENVVGIPALIMGMVHKELAEDKEAIVDFTVGVTTIDNLNWTFAFNEAILVWREMTVHKDRIAMTRVAHELYGDSPGLTVSYPGERPKGVLKFNATVFREFLHMGSRPPLLISSITLHITGKDVTGAMEFDSERYAIQATIDDNGTISGTFKVETQTYRFSCRLPGNEALLSDPIIKENGVWFIAYDEDLNRFAVNAFYRVP
jgi:hypothetical protein